MNTDMNNGQSVLLSWSGGKDCSMALAALREDPAWEVSGLLTTVNARAGRVAMHGTRESLLIAQAEALGLPVHVVHLPDSPSNAIYEEKMGEALARARAAGIDTVAFGDLYLADIREYREAQMARAGMKAIFPIWQRNTTDMAQTLIEQGYRLKLSCVDSEQLDPAFLGREFDQALLAELPEGVDPCGENGEFHSFVWDSPLHRHPLPVRTGETVIAHERFHFIDLIPETPGPGQGN